MQKIEVTDWTISGSGGQTIYGNTHWPDEEARGVLICCHGFKGYKDYGFFPKLCDYAAQNRLAAARFNFSHSGMTNQIKTFERPELFEKDTWGRQLEDLASVFDHIASNSNLPCVIFGHSRGGVTSTLFTGKLAKQSLTGLITAAAPDYACNLDDLVKDQLRREGRFFSSSGRTGQDLYVGLDWLEEIERDPELYDPIIAAAHVKCPLLILHGDDDQTVPAECAKKLHQAASPHSELAIIADANHVFNCPNPVPAGTSLKKLPSQTRELIERSVGFALRCCS